MRHYRLDTLEEKDGRLFHRGEPFTGVAHEVRGDRVVSNSVVEGGIRGGPEAHWNPARLRVLSRAVTAIDPDEIDAQHPEVGDYLGGALFKGVAYVFDGDTGMLLEELDFDPELGELSREWYSSGALLTEHNRARPDGGRESVSYDEDGRTKSVSMSQMRWSLTPELRLRTLHIHPGYPEGDLQRVPAQVDSMLRLCGKAVTDRTVEWLDGLSRVEELDLDKTGITAEGLARFGVCARLRELVTYTNEGFRDEDVRALLASLPGCKWDRR